MTAGRSGAPRRIRGVLLDVDGTLIDSNDAHAASWADTFREFGFDIPFAKIRPLIGMGGDKLLPELTGLDAENERARAMTERRAKIFDEQYLGTLKAFPGAHELLARLKEDGLALIIATSAEREQLNKLLEQAGLEELVDRKTSSSDAENSKPDPDIIEAALKKGKLEPSHAVMLGDTPYDIEAAGKAGVACIALRCGGWKDEELGAAAAIYDDARDLLRSYDSSPIVAL